MITPIVIALTIIHGKSCIDDVFKTLPTHTAEYSFNYNCYTMKDQELKPTWDKYGEIIKSCPNAAKWYKEDTSNSALNALERTALRCDSLINSPLEMEKREKAKSLKTQDSIRIAQKQEDDDIKASKKYEKENARIEKNFKNNKAKYIAAFTACLKEYANDPSSVKVAKAIHISDNDYEVIYRAKNGFGALILTSAQITLNKSMKCIEIKNPNDESDENSSDDE